MRPIINLTKRVRRRKLRSGDVVEQLRYVLNYKEPKTGQRRQEFFEQQKLAQARRAKLTIAFSEGSYLHKEKVPTVAEASENWLRDKEGKVKAMTIEGCSYVVAHIVGPIMVGTPQQRAEFTRAGVKPPGVRFLPMLAGSRSVT